MNWTIQKLLDWAKQSFKKNKITPFGLEAESILAYALKLKRLDLYLKFDQEVKPEDLSHCQELINRRLKGGPLTYIVGFQPFMGLEIIVSPDVLIPRPETEEMVELAIKLAKTQSIRSIVDVGTGSGCIAVALAKHIPKAKVIGIDISPQTVEIAKKNAKKHGVSDRCQFVVGNIFNLKAPLGSLSKFDLIISNPPYIPTHDIAKLDKSVKDFEPLAALDGGIDGLDYIRQLIEAKPRQLLIEFGLGQARAIEELAQKKYNNFNILKDLTGRSRFLLAQQ